MQEETKLLSAVIGDVYDAAMDPDAWPRALASICACTHSAACTINYHDMSKGAALLAHEHGTDLHFSRLYVEHYADKNPLVAAIMSEAIGDPKRMRDLVPSEVFEASQLYLEWCAPQRYDDLLAACIYRDAARVGALAVVRRIEDGRYSDNDVDLFATIGAHVHRSLSIGNHLALRRADAVMFGSIVDRLPTAVLLIDHGGWVLYRNEAADQLMAKQRVARIVNQKLSLNGVDLQVLVASVARRRFYETAIDAGSAERGIQACRDRDERGAAGSIQSDCDFSNRASRLGQAFRSLPQNGVRIDARGDPRRVRTVRRACARRHRLRDRIIDSDREKSDCERPRKGRRAHYERPYPTAVRGVLSNCLSIGRTRFINFEDAQALSPWAIFPCGNDVFQIGRSWCSSGESELRRHRKAQRPPSSFFGSF